VKFTALFILLLVAVRGDAAPVPRHLFPPEVELCEGMTWLSPSGDRYTIIMFKGDECFVEIFDTNEPIDFNIKWQPEPVRWAWIPKASARKAYRQRQEDSP
jgi:hypothetical protein